MEDDRASLGLGTVPGTVGGRTGQLVGMGSRRPDSSLAAVVDLGIDAAGSPVAGGFAHFLVAAGLAGNCSATSGQ